MESGFKRKYGGQHSKQKAKKNFSKSAIKPKRKRRVTTDSSGTYATKSNIIKQRKLVNLPRTLENNSRNMPLSSRNLVTEENKKIIQQVIEKCYNPQVRSLNLEKFHEHEEFTGNYFGLYRQPIQAATADIIVENIPELEALNLNENKLNIIDRLKIFRIGLKQLKVLYLANNNIAMFNSLDVFIGLPLIEMYLEGNPFIEAFESHDSYVREVRKKWPKLTKLDGKEFGPIIEFDVTEEKIELPSWKKLFLCDSSGQAIVSKFVEEYYSIYDSESRTGLLAAYHDNSFISITTSTLQNSTPVEALTAYHNVSRNFLRSKLSPEMNATRLKRGKAATVALLCDLPLTKHDPQAMAVDLTFFTPQMIILTITGVFKERKESNPKAEHVRTFHRTFTIVPNNFGLLCIMNDMMHVTNATLLQSKKAFKTLIIPKPLPMTISTELLVPQLDDNTKLQMIQSMMAQTNMNYEWSKKCLEENNFDYNRACFVFNELYKVNKVPPEAFNK